MFAFHNTVTVMYFPMTNVLLATSNRYIVTGKGDVYSVYSNEIADSQ